MQNSKPIKRHKALIKFSQEHHDGLLLCWKIRQGLKNKTDLKKVVNYVLFFFDNDLKKHFGEEENILFPQLPADDLLRQRAENEHKAVYNMLEKFKTGPANVAALNEFADKLDNHIRFEERILFNHIQQKLSENELIQLNDRLTQRSGDVDLNWEDHFWNLK